ncbi:universal stress protein [Rhabdothermincola salaria]|uniref:universal stress protein n=1 Tax=Rhabdothermincola salaria TaxID=2903142 RepID=UPI001E3184EC|nr:universal stress protein [Rhabdothermincola salaria]MCD9624339.1 universal stress protein [Rhabdothermincola salaria]
MSDAPPPPAGPPLRRPVAVAVDGSEGSRIALRWAAATATATGTKLRVLRSWEYPSSLPLPFADLNPKAPETIDDEILEELRGFVDETLGDTHGAELSVLRGPAAAAILGAVDERRPSMLVVGSRGLGGFRGLLLGSVSRRCLEYASCTVVVVPEGTTPAAGLHHLVVGLDGSDASGLALRWARDVAVASGAALTALHVFSPPFAEIPPQVVAELRQEADQQVQRAMDRAAVAPDLVTVEGDPRDALMGSARERQADLVVVGATGGGSVKHLLGAVSAHLAAHTPLPLAVVRTDLDD